MIAGTAAILILVVLAGVHIYWAVGGKAGKGAAIPSKNGRPVLMPGPTTTLLVALGLFAIAALLAVQIGWFALPAFPYQHDLVQVAVWLIATVFALRAIGDFRYVGFFKRVRDGRFARLDTFAYSPLCAGLALLVGISAVT
jgi:Protein of unknown function (DUF3995)